MTMNEHLHIHKKTGYQSASTPQHSLFQSRPFVVQPQTEEQSEQPDIKTALERAKRYGHSLDRIKFAEAPVQRPVRRIVQAKLTIGEPGDRYEQEADRVAASVVQQINAPVPQQSTQSQSVQREATPDEEDELMNKPDISAIQRQEEQEEEIQAKPEITALQRQEEQEEEIQAKPNVSDLGRSPLPTQVQREAMPEEEELQTKSILQRREAIGGGEASTDVESAINSAKGGGQPLEAGLQKSMGQAMGADFSGVKVHTDAQADQLNQSVQARAFTTGQDVFFRSGEYNPGSRGGQELLAHELTHVVQQSGAAVQRSSQPQEQLQQNAAASSVVQRDDRENQDLDTSYAVVTATSNESLGGGHTAIYLDICRGGRHQYQKIHLTYGNDDATGRPNTQDASTISDSSSGSSSLNSSQPGKGVTITIEDDRQPREKDNQKNWYISVEKAEALLAKAREIQGNQDMYSYTLLGVSPFKRKVLNCAKFGEIILGAAGIKVSAGRVFKLPSNLTK